MTIAGFEAMTIQDAIVLGAILICVSLFWSR